MKQASTHSNFSWSTGSFRRRKRRWSGGVAKRSRSGAGTEPELEPEKMILWIKKTLMWVISFFFWPTRTKIKNYRKTSWSPILAWPVYRLYIDYFYHIQYAKLTKMLPFLKGIFEKKTPNFHFFWKFIWVTHSIKKKKIGWVILFKYVRHMFWYIRNLFLRAKIESLKWTYHNHDFFKNLWRTQLFFLSEVTNFARIFLPKTTGNLPKVMLKMRDHGGRKWWRISTNRHHV